MKKILYLLVPLILLALVIFKLKGNKEIAQSNIYRYDKERPLNVQVDTLKLQPIDDSRYFTGVFEPEKEVKISAESQGRIVSLLVDAGSYVKRGQLLLKMDAALLKLQLQTVSIQIDGLEADVNRFTILTNADAIQGIQLEKTQLGLKSARVQRKTILEQISKTNVYAPFSGIVSLKMTETGAFAAPGLPLLQLTDISRLRLTVNVPEKEVHLFILNKNYSITADAYNELSFSGKAILIGSKGNIASNFPVQFSISNTPGQIIKSGMFGKVLIAEAIPGQGLMLPSSAIVGSDIEPQVYVVKNNKAILQRISIAQRTKKGIVVKDGLVVGDIVITGGFINLSEGAAVTVSN